MMDCYKLLHAIAEGPLGQTLLVEEKSSGDKCVIKKVECRDYTQAVLAHNQALELEQLNGHHSVCSYRHFFVQWDRHAHAVYLCIVSDYHELGNLAAFIDKQRSKNEPLEEQLLKKWAGQLVEGLCHAHQQGQLHRNLKPSNVLLTSDSSLVLSDFAVPVAMTNLREVTKRRGGTLRWLSPEQLVGGGGGGGGEEGGQKADVWSLGCVLLELATCGYMDGSSYSVLLHQLHRDPSVLEGTLERVGKFYSSEVCQLLESCLRRSLEQRLSIIELVKWPAMQECLAPSSGVATDSADQENADPPDQLADTNQEEDVPGERTNQEEDVPVVQTRVRFQEVQEVHVEPRGIQDILETMRACPDDRQALLHCCIQLWNHTLSEGGCDEVSRCGGVEVICDTLSAHTTDAQLSNAACSLLWSLSLRGIICPEMAKYGAVDILLKTVQAHPDDPGVTKYACLTLASLAKTHEALAFRVILSETEIEGIPIILNSLTCLESHKETVKAVAQLLEALCGYVTIQTYYSTPELELQEFTIFLSVAMTIPKLDPGRRREERAGEPGSCQHPGPVAGASCDQSE